ncbi:unnamed protein product [Lactuca saligna]|uniref:Uncharacterized protein n=1 Tax=Lactuca saligna TaxID=75948 RepID=A0AA36E846_LACSI|nr:unnamed protein product [Lactuca saligna]
MNTQLKGFRGHNHTLHEFILADLPLMNPYDRISLFHFVVKDMKKCEPIFEHFKRMIKCYILELAMIDVQISSVLKRKPILKTFDQPQNIENLRGGLIDKQYWSTV